MIEQAAAYADYRAKAGAVSPLFTDAAQVQAALTLSQGSDPQSLRRGAVAYAAILALQDPAFVAGVRTFVEDSAQRRAIVLELYKDPAYAVGFKGSDSAAGRIIASLGDAGTQVYMSGKRVKQAAYDVQRQAWSKSDVLDRDGRLQRAKTMATLPMTPSIERLSLLQSAASGAIPLSGIG